LKKTALWFLILSLFAVPCQASESLTVTRVISGDMLELSNGETVRLIGVEIPASFKKEATEFTRKLVAGKHVRLEYDVQRKDKYGRTLAYVHVDIGGEEIIRNIKTGKMSSAWQEVWIFLNEAIIREGYAQVMPPAHDEAGQDVPPNVKYQDLFVKREKEARENKRGVWK
jgi:micrococcal nuclease